MSLFHGDGYSFGFLYNPLSLFLLARGYLNFLPWKPMFSLLAGTLTEGARAPWRGYHQTFWEKWIFK